MPRYFFNLRHRSGPSGLAAIRRATSWHVAAAREHALRAARDTIARTRTNLVRDWFACSFEIVDEHGQPVMTVPFSDTVPDEDED